MLLRKLIHEENSQLALEECQHKIIKNTKNLYQFLFLMFIFCFSNYLVEGIPGSARAAADSHVLAAAVVVMVVFAECIYV